MENNTNETVQEPSTVIENLEDTLTEEKTILENRENQSETVLGISEDILDTEPDKELVSDVSVDKDTAGHADDCAVKLNSETTDIGGQLDDAAKREDGIEIDQDSQKEATLKSDTNNSESAVTELDISNENGDTNVNTVNKEESDECIGHEEHVCVNTIEDNAKHKTDETGGSTVVAELDQCECNGLGEILDEASTLTEIPEQNSKTVEAGVNLEEKDMGANSSSDEGSAKDTDDPKGDNVKRAENDTNQVQHEPHVSTTEEGCSSNVDSVNEPHVSTTEEGCSSNVDSVNEVGEDAKLANVLEINTVSETAKTVEHTNSEETLNTNSSDVDCNKSEEKVKEENLITTANTVESTPSDSTECCGIVHSDAESLVVCQSESTKNTDAAVSTDTCSESEMDAPSHDKTSANAITNTDTVIILEAYSEIEKTSQVDKETYTDENTTLELEKESKALKLESEAMLLREELAGMRASLKASQCHTQQQQARYNEKVMSLKLELYRSQTALKQQRAKSDSQLADVISHLTLLEGQLKKEQWKVKGEIRHKNEMIENQKKEIVKLKDQNEQLLNAIKEICANGGMNGYMRENKQRNVHFANGVENGGKNGKEKKSHNGKLGSVKDKFSWKNRSSLELGNLNLEKYLIQQERLCSSQEDLQKVGTGQDSRSGMLGPGDRFRSASVSGRPIPSRSQNFFDPEMFNGGVSKSLSESSQLSDVSNTSGMYSMSDHDDSITNGDHYEDDEEDDRHFSFSSTHINMVIDEEDTIGPIMSHSGQMMSMGSMPTLANIGNDDLGQRLYSAKNRPHSLSSVDLVSIQQQARNLAVSPVKSASPGSTSTPPPSPSYSQSKAELTPFQTFKTMFKRKGSKNKGNKKRSVSLSQTTNKEYSEALKKHFQKYDMS